jgi:SAM-dependent methyltransferase
MTTLQAHDWRWRPEGGYYRNRATELESDPLLPDLRTRRDARIARLFDQALPNERTPEVLELGCGASRWLPYLALRKGCRVTGLDYEPAAVALTIANMRGAGAEGEILCRDAFSVGDNVDLVGRFDVVYSMGLLEHFADIGKCLDAAARYLRPRGVIVTTVPNLQGVNWALQRFGDLRVLQTHVVYDVVRLRACHERTGFVTRAAGYLGFYDGFMSDTAPGVAEWRRRAHHTLCRVSNLAAQGWVSLTRGHLTPEAAWLAPKVYYVGRRPW